MQAQYWPGAGPASQPLGQRRAIRKAHPISVEQIERRDQRGRNTAQRWSDARPTCQKVDLNCFPSDPAFAAAGSFPRRDTRRRDRGTIIMCSIVCRVFTEHFTLRIPALVGNSSQ